MCAAIANSLSPVPPAVQSVCGHLHPVQEAHRGGGERTGSGPGRRAPAAVRRGVGQRESLVPDALHRLRPDARHLLLLHLPAHHGRGIGTTSHLWRRGVM